MKTIMSALIALSTLAAIATQVSAGTDLRDYNGRKICTHGDC
jgi:hypothetical protein